MFKSKRFYVSLVVFGIFLLLPFVPWYVPYIIAIVAGWHFNYFEMVFLGFLMDLSYPSNSSIFEYSFPFICTFISAGIYLVLQIIKKRVRFYA